MFPAAEVYDSKAVGALPCFFAQISKLIFRHVATNMVVINVVYILQVLWK